MYLCIYMRLSLSFFAFLCHKLTPSLSAYLSDFFHLYILSSREHNQFAASCGSIRGSPCHLGGRRGERSEKWLARRYGQHNLTNIRTYKHAYIYRYIHTQTHTHTGTRTPSHTHTHAHRHTHTHTQTHTHTHRHTHTHTHRHTLICIVFLALNRFVGHSQNL